MRLLSLKLYAGIICLCVLACVKPQQNIEPVANEVLVPKTITSIPKDTVLVLPKDTLIAKNDTVKKVAVQDTVKKKPEGEQIFEFYEITSPDISISLPSHSIVMIPVTYVGKDIGVANSFCEYWLYTKDGKLVCYCKNTVSGLHPVYANNFNTNNHLPQFTKKIAYGEYRLVYKNISKEAVRQDLMFGLIINENKDQINVKVDSGETREFWINIYPSTSAFKMNNNNKDKI
ncbi:hypothetical protein Emtol_2425 [Emticicia oligotrophica DSM 17448]|uniref:Lipoprotein n=1 Tax=Emticicia oligotrophica (strain DSM 17448 / CIP 109782 / MTCC 6937 / GPTSA100-15) TaxID=929562 RepID=A0ABM5N2L6_EMTOG|nr:MmcQ/YjbR family DNA-binding protein [Emticicia oligotrophica]AFK03561.1 hypothetical protein Emtol_2425 [Emticicia oligotrophica DSM 17448]